MMIMMMMMMMMMMMVRPCKVLADYTVCTVNRVKSNPITGLDRPSGFQKVEAPRFLYNRHMKVIRLSGLRTGRLYLPGNIPGPHFC
jgi:hypothetical protein